MPLDYYGELRRRVLADETLRRSPIWSSDQLLELADELLREAGITEVEMSRRTLLVLRLAFPKADDETLMKFFVDTATCIIEEQRGKR